MMAILVKESIARVDDLISVKTLADLINYL